MSLISFDASKIILEDTPSTLKIIQNVLSQILRVEIWVKFERDEFNKIFFIPMINENQLQIEDPNLLSIINKINISDFSGYIFISANPITWKTFDDPEYDLYRKFIIEYHNCILIPKRRLLLLRDKISDYSIYEEDDEFFNSIDRITMSYERTGIVYLPEYLNNYEKTLYTWNFLKVMDIKSGSLFLCSNLKHKKYLTQKWIYNLPLLNDGDVEIELELSEIIPKLLNNESYEFILSLIHAELNRPNSYFRVNEFGLASVKFMNPEDFDNFLNELDIQWKRIQRSSSRPLR